jgi:WD40 repeat protein
MGKATIAGLMMLAAMAGCSTTELSADGDQGPPPTSPVTRIAYLQDGRIAVASKRSVLLFDQQLETVQRVPFTYPDGAVPLYGDISANGEVALAVWSTKPVGGAVPPTYGDLTRVSDGQALSRITLRYQVGDVTLSPDGSLVAVQQASDQGPEIWTYRTSDGAWLWAGPSDGTSFRFSPDGGSLYAGSVAGFRTYDATTGAAGVVGMGAALDLSVAPDGAHLLGPTYDERVLVWSTTDGSVERTVEETPNFKRLFPVAANADGALASLGYPIVDGGGGYSLQVWDEQGDLRYHVRLPEKTFFADWIAFSPSGEEILVGTTSRAGDVALHLFRASDGAPLADRTIAADLL